MNSLYRVVYITETQVAAFSSDWWVKTLIIAVVIGLLVGLVYALILKGQLTSVYRNDSAEDYTKDKSFKVEVKRDTFLYSKVTKEEKPEQK